MYAAVIDAEKAIHMMMSREFSSCFSKALRSDARRIQVNDSDSDDDLLYDVMHDIIHLSPIPLKYGELDDDIYMYCADCVDCLCSRAPCHENTYHVFVGFIIEASGDFDVSRVPIPLIGTGEYKKFEEFMLNEYDAKMQAVFSAR